MRVTWKFKGFVYQKFQIRILYKPSLRYLHTEITFASYYEIFINLHQEVLNFIYPFSPIFSFILSCSKGKKIQNPKKRNKNPKIISFISKLFLSSHIKKNSIKTFSTPQYFREYLVVLKKKKWKFLRRKNILHNFFFLFFNPKK